MPFWGKGGRGHLGRFPEQPFVPCQHRQPDPLRPTGCRLVGPCQQRQSVSISPAACSNHCRKKPFIVANKKPRVTAFSGGSGDGGTGAPAARSVRVARQAGVSRLVAWGRGLQVCSGDVTPDTLPQRRAIDRGRSRCGGRRRSAGGRSSGRVTPWGGVRRPGGCRHRTAGGISSRACHRGLLERPAGRGAAGAGLPLGQLGQRAGVCCTGKVLNFSMRMLEGALLPIAP